jgi:hypothetical protein
MSKKLLQVAALVGAALLVCGCGKSAEELKAEQEANENALRSAAAKGDVAAVKDLLKKGTQVDAKDRRGETALMYAVNDTLERSASREFDRQAVVRELLAQGADVHAVGNRGMNVLMKASAFGNADLVRQLLKAGADLQAKDDSGMTALMWAANQPVSVNDTAEIVEFLIEAGADVDEKSRDGYTALDYARRHDSNPKVVQMIEEAQAPEVAQNDSDSEAPKGSEEKADDLVKELFSIPGRVMKKLPELQKSLGRPIPAADLTKIELNCSLNEPKADGVMVCNVKNRSDWTLQAFEIEFRGSTEEGHQEVRQFLVTPESGIAPARSISFRRDTGIFAKISVASYSILYAVGTEQSSEPDSNEDKTTGARTFLSALWAAGFQPAAGKCTTTLPG